MANIWKKIYGIVNAALRLGVQGPTIAGTGNTVTVRDNVGTGAATFDVDKTVSREFDVVATDGKKTLITMQTGAAVDVPFGLPNSKGNAGDTLKTDGNGNLYFDTENQEGVRVYTLNFNSSNTINLDLMPNNFHVNKIMIEVTTPFTGGTGSTLQIGVSGTTNKFVDAADNSLSVAGTFDLDVGQLQAASAQMIATYAANGATAGAAKIYTFGAVPK